MNEQQFEQLAFVLSLRCVECDRRWDNATERWRIYFTCDEPPEPGQLCIPLLTTGRMNQRWP